MHSLTKVLLTHEITQAIVAHHFGSRCRVTAFQELKEGMFNAAARLELNDGQKFVLKAAPPGTVRVMRYEKNIMRAEVESMRLVRQQTRVPVPEIYCYDTARTLLDSDFFIMQCLPGIPFNKLRGQLPAEAQAVVQGEMGRLARQMSEITGPAFGYWAQPEPPGCAWRDCFAHMLQGILQDGMDVQVELPLPYATLYQQLEQHFDVLAEVDQPRLVHWDLWDGNVFVDPLTLRITGLIDFERVLWADPLTEAFFGLPDIPPLDSPVVAGFGGVILRTPNQRRRRLLYNAYLFLIMVIECTFRQYETQDQENWARTRLNETLQELG